MRPYLKRIETNVIKDQLFSKLPAEKLNELKGELATKVQDKLGGQGPSAKKIQRKSG